MPVDNILRRVEDLEKRVALLESALLQPAVAAPRQKKQSIKEFLMSFGEINAVVRTLIVGAYLEQHVGVTTFNIADIEAAFRAAKEKPPVNINDMVNKNIRKGYMMDATAKKDGKKAWNLTLTGEKFLTNVSRKA